MSEKEETRRNLERLQRLFSCISGYLKDHDDNDTAFLGVIAEDIMRLVERGSKYDHVREYLESLFLGFQEAVKRDVRDLLEAR